MARETGWSERYILWELPLSRLWQYYHAALRRQDIWTVRDAPGKPDTASSVDAAILNAQTAESGDDDDEG